MKHHLGFVDSSWEDDHIKRLARDKFLEAVDASREACRGLPMKTRQSVFNLVFRGVLKRTLVKVVRDTKTLNRIAEECIKEKL